MSHAPLPTSGPSPSDDPLIRPAERGDYRGKLRRQWSEVEVPASAVPAVETEVAAPPVERRRTREARPGKTSVASKASRTRSTPANDSLPELAPAGEHPDIELLREIERDEVSSLHEGYERHLRRYVTVRKLLPELRGETALEELFWSQARGGAGLQHEHLQAIYSIDTARRWVILEPFDHSLAERLKKGPLPPAEVQSVVEQALRGLAYLHSRGQIHGGLHPATLLMNKDNQLKLTRTPGLDPKSELRLPPGGGRYLAPELLAPQMFGQVGPACDLYALGLTALELLTGPRFVRLFKGIQGRGETSDSWARWHCSPSERLPAVSTLGRGIPDELARVLDKLLEKNVADRYPSAQEALQDLLASRALSVLKPLEPAGESVAGVPASRTSGSTSVALSVPPSLLPGQVPYSRHVLSGDSPGDTPNSLGGWQQVLRSPKQLVHLAVGGVVLLFLATMVLSGGSPAETDEPAPLAKASPAAVAEIPLDDEIDPAPESRFAMNLPVEPPEKPVEPPPVEPPPAPVPPPPPGPVALVLNSIPAGAEIEIDGLRQEQRTPLNLSLLPGKYQVVLRRAHHRTVRQTIEITPQTQKPFEFELAAHAPPALDVPRIAAPRGGPQGEAAQLARAWMIDRWLEFKTFSPLEQEEVWKRHGALAQTDPRLPHALALLVLFEKSDQASGDRTGRLRRAVQLLERADQLSPPPQYVLHLRRLAWCQLHLRRPDEALQACRRMLTQSRLSNDKALHREAVRFTAAVLVLAEQSPGLGRITTSWQLNEIEPELHSTFRDDVEDFLQQRLEGDKLAQILPEPIGHERDLLLRTLDGSSSGAAEPKRGRAPQATAQRAPWGPTVGNRDE